MKLDTFLETTQVQLEAALQNTFRDSGNVLLKEAIHYSLLGGGKRLRPALVRASALASGDDSERWLIPAQALEMIHVYSLIHDDLPAMDNDDLRRGKPTNHKQFDEATAILAGDALQSEAFRILAETPQLNDATARQMILALATASGAAGMVAGQMVDLQSENVRLTMKQLAELHQLKTGALIRCALTLGALCTDNNTMIPALTVYGDAIGLTFQIIDDILDITASTEILGKPQGSDLSSHKSTYVSLLGLDGANTQAKAQYQRATTALGSLGLDSDSLLWQLADYVLERDH
jgi:geranylgeranyl pyrophosphate synthase